MRYSLLPAVAAAALLAAPALAQNNSNTETTPNAQTEAPQAHTGAMKHHRHMARAELKQSLEQAGFKDIRITAESYVVHARDKNGSPVVMMISPDEVTGVVEENGSSGSSAPPRSGSTMHEHGGTHNNGTSQ